MEKLLRTFVSHKAKYIIIYDDAVSSTPGRKFEWRLQTKGTLENEGEKTYKVTNGAGSTLIKILSPTEVNWSVTINKIGNILHARLSDQQKNNFLVLLWPNASNLNAISENYNTSTAEGVKITIDGNNEYTLFQKADHVNASVGNIDFNGNTLILIENNTGKSMLSVSLVNGDRLSYNSINYLSTDKLMNFGIESISADKTEVIYHFGPSSGSGDSPESKIILGGLLKNTTYYLKKEGETTGIEVKTDRKGQGAVIINLTQSCRYFASKKS